MASPIDRRMERDVSDRIVELAVTTDLSPKAIFEKIQTDPRFQGLTLPKIRTVQRAVKDLRPPTPTGGDDPEVGGQLWTLADSSSEDAVKILEARRASVLRNRGPIDPWSKHTAWAVAKILRAAPGLPLGIAWLVATFYQIELRREGTQAFDDYLAFAPWRDESSHELYTHTVELGWIKPVPLWRVLVEEQNPALSFEERGRLAGINEDLLWGISSDAAVETSGDGKETEEGGQECEAT